MFKRVIVFLLCLGFALSGQSQAASITDSLGYHKVEAKVSWYVHSPELEEKLEGILQVSLPDWFVFLTQDEDGELTSRVGQFQGVVSNGRAKTHRYEYQPSQLFALYQQFLWLIEKGAVLPDNSLDVGLLEELELQILDQGESESGELLWAEIWWEEHQLYLLLEREDSYWFPTVLEMSQDGITVAMEFSEWGFLEQFEEIESLQSLVELINSGEESFAEGNWEQVISNFNDALKIDPYYLPGYFYLGYSYGELGDYLSTVDKYSQWLMLQPDQPLALNNLAYTYMLREVHLSKALEMAKRASELDSQPAYLDTVGYGYYLIGEYDLALDYLYQALDSIDSSMEREVLQHLLLVYTALDNQEMIALYKERLYPQSQGELGYE